MKKLSIFIPLLTFFLFLFALKQPVIAGEKFPDGTNVCTGKPFTVPFETNRTLVPGESVTCTITQVNNECKPCCSKNPDGSKGACLAMDASCSIGAGGNTCIIDKQDCFCKDFTASCEYTYKSQPKQTLKISVTKISIGNNFSMNPPDKVTLPPVPKTGECDNNCRIASDNTCNIGSCQSGQRRTGIRMCDGNSDGTETNCGPDQCKADSSCPTTGGACGKPCSSSNPATCQGAHDGCTYCPPGGGACSTPPTPTPSPTTGPTTCVPGKTTCTTASCNGDVGVCRPACNGGWCKDSVCFSCKPAPTKPPTPPFSANMCKCDGIDVTDIFSGRDATFTAFSKVEGADVSNAYVKSVEFNLTQDEDQLATKTIIPTVISRTSSLIRYKSVWTVKIPENPSTTALYRVFAKIKCSPKTTGGYIQPSQTLARASFSPSESVLGVTTEPTGDPLQIGTFYPGQVVSKTCNFVHFKFGGQ